MSKSLALPTPTNTGMDTADKLKELEFLIGKADENLHEALSANTRKAYRNQWDNFVAWCSAMGMPAFPTQDTVLLVYLTHRVEKGAALSTITQIYCAIREHHRMNDEKPPTLDGKLYRSWTGARKKSSRGREIVKAKALLVPELKQIVGGSLQGSLTPRDRALLLIGWCAALRSEEIVQLNVSDITVEEDGLRIKIRQSKTDQLGFGHEIGISRGSEGSCPVEAWLELVAQSGEALHPFEPAFPSIRGHRLLNKDVTRILKRRMKRAGLDSKGYSAHSLRAGCLTAAAQAGHPLEAIQRHSRHKSLEVLLGYIRTATLLTDNVTKGLL